MKTETSELEKIFQLCDVGWVFERATFGEDPDDVGLRILRELDAVEAAVFQSFPVRGRPSLLAEIRADVTRFKPLVQAFASPVTAAMRAMVYAVLIGGTIARIEFSYQYKESIRLSVVVEHDSGESFAFVSDDAWDVEVLRHFGIMKLGEKPVLDGYYAFRRTVE